MSKLVVLNLGIGDLGSGFPAVTAQLSEPGNPHPMQFRGSLPAAPEIAELHRAWRLLYQALYHRLGWQPRLKIHAAGITNVSQTEFGDLCRRLVNTINTWLNSEPFRHIDQQLRARLGLSEEIRFIVETNDILVRRLPWHLWEFFEDYPKAELALSTPEYQLPGRSLPRPSSGKVKILAILGNSGGIDIEKDRAFLEQLSDQAETEFLVEPQPETLDDQLWEHGWDILFFAGHSSSQETGLLQLNQTDSLELNQLRYALKKAISRGLKLAIFNSCDGLGLAQSLADLYIPQVIVMREPVPDVVAQEFLRHFLAAFSSGQSLYTSVREARERLQILESKYPCATWLPVICQNPVAVSATWQEWHPPKQRNGPRLAHGDSPAETLRERQPSLSWSSFAIGLLVGVAVTTLVTGVRQLGLLQSSELKAFDQLMQLRPEEKADPRLLVVTVTEADIQAQAQGKGSLSDRALSQLLEKLEQYQPRAIGLDIYRDFPVESAYRDLATRLRRNKHFIAVCKSSDAEDDPSGVPPPPEIPSERIGFSDFVEDPDGILRRHLLAMTPEPASSCRASYALNVLLAFHYLTAEGILPKFTPEGNLQLGTVVFERLKNHTGGYQNVDTRGNQVLLNYRSSRSSQKLAPEVTLSQVLAGQLNPNAVKDRIVLIGTTANSVRDNWSVPYSPESSEEMPGVLIHAQMVSQILSAVLDQRPLLRIWPWWGDVLWIGGWSLIGGILAFHVRQLSHLGLAIATALGALYGLSFCLLLTTGAWVPLVPAGLALVVTGGSIRVYAIFQPSDRNKYYA